MQSVAPLQPLAPLEMPVKPGPGQVLLYVVLSEVENMTISETLALLVEMGYQPELRYRQWKDESSTLQTSLYAVLKDEQHGPTTEIDSEYLAEELETLWNHIQPDLAVRCPRGLPKKSAGVAA
ncbi:acyl carrier protein [Trichocoleus sp. FACHB-262]|uniref:acyl carrier protein n=1 Tax=Trichocoleus sp. FACHB-262 TaxID=2692869 RepID=UPI0016846B80|nr:acyl carrier protein [Trichocoleus sp. FACHB-262]MBD2122533.1 acyl carrier protein [Trichocoleus sp. FACHB-262]